MSEAMVHSHKSNLRRTSMENCILGYIASIYNRTFLNLIIFAVFMIIMLVNTLSDTIRTIISYFKIKKIKQNINYGIPVLNEFYKKRVWLTAIIILAEIGCFIGILTIFKTPNNLLSGIYLFGGLILVLLYIFNTITTAFQSKYAYLTENELIVYNGIAKRGKYTFTIDKNIGDNNESKSYLIVSNQKRCLRFRITEKEDEIIKTITKISKT